MVAATNLEIPDVVLLEPEVFQDDRGYFMEAWNREDFAIAIGGHQEFVQDNESRSRGGVLRGLHYQLPNEQGKLVRVSIGRAFTVAVDVRRSSPTFRRWVACELSERNKRQLWLPPGFAHGFLTLADPTFVFYKVTAFFAPEHDHTVRWNDPAIGIEWPLAGAEPIMSERDRLAPLLADAAVFA